MVLTVCYLASEHGEHPSEEILRSIAKVTGGFLAKEDYSGSVEEIGEAESGNLKFLVNHALIKEKKEAIRQAHELLSKATGITK